MNSLTHVLPLERRIWVIRGQRVMLDADLAEVYGVSTKRLNEQVKRNRDRFPKDFIFRLTPAEAKSIEDAWAIEAQRDGRLLALTADEAARRYFGVQGYEARRITVARMAPMPTIALPNTPTPAGFPTGHLVSDASNGGANGNRGGYAPPPRDKGPQLEDARRAAHAALNS